MENNNAIRLTLLLEKYVSGSFDMDELPLLESLLQEPGADQIWEEFFLSDMAKEDPSLAKTDDVDWNKIWTTIQNNKEPNSENSNTGKLHYLFTYRIKSIIAASLILVIGTIAYFAYKGSNTDKHSIAINSNQESRIAPGKDGAILHLANGQAIDLNNAKDGLLATQAGVKIIKDNKSIRYEGQATELLRNEITTDNGRQWHLILADGTNVWLNAASSIQYPISFTANERVVAITGEAYFEVVHNTVKPFRVHIEDQTIEDLGTSFNINAYKDAGTINTTLLTGSLAVRKLQQYKVLKPGQQASVDDQIKIRTIPNVEDIIAWKNGLFSFSGEDLSAVLKQIARWYNVTIVYNTSADGHKFTGTIPRDIDIDDVLKILEQAGIHLKKNDPASPNEVGKIIVEP